MIAGSAIMHSKAVKEDEGWGDGFKKQGGRSIYDEVLEENSSILDALQKQLNNLKQKPKTIKLSHKPDRIDGFDRLCFETTKAWKGLATDEAGLSPWHLGQLRT